MYSLFEYNKKGHMRVVREEALEEGRDIERTRIIESMSSKGMSPEEIANLCDWSVDEVKKIIKEIVN